MSQLLTHLSRPAVSDEPEGAHPVTFATSLPRLVWGGCGLALAYLLALLTAPPSTVEVLSDLSFVLFPAIAAVSCFTGASTGPAGPRRTWRLMALSMAVWTGGGLVWCLTSFTRAEVPFPSLADVGFIGYALPAAAALLLIPLARPSRLMRLEILLDGAVIAVAVTFCVWALVLEPVQAAGSDPSLAQLVLLSYPIADTVTISLVLATVMRVRFADLRSWIALLLGLLVLAATDLLYVSLVARGSYEASAPYNILWAVAFLLIAAAPHLGGLSAPGGRQLSVGQALVPYAAMAAVLALVLGRDIDLTSSSALVSLGLLLVLLAAARHVLVVVVKTKLTNDLDREVRRVTSDLRDEREFLRALVDSLEAGVIACDRNGQLTYYNRSVALLHSDPEAKRIAEWAQDLRTADGATQLALEDIPLFRVLGGESVENVEVMVVPPDAPALAFSVSGRPLTDEGGAVVGAVVALHDITEHRRQQDALKRKALRDELTSLGNRAAFTEQLQGRLAAHVPVGLLLLDLDDFKHINDSLGHDAGDQYLVLTARRLVAALPAGCTAFRLGGDEFVVLVESNVAAPVVCAHVVLEAVAESAQVEGIDIQTTASVGIALSGTGYGTVGELLKAADLAMYAAKAAGKGRISHYEERLRGAAQDRLALENDLRRAIGTDELSLVYQPIVEVTTGRMRAAEALLRWNHPQRGPVSPAEFIPVAEQCGLILPLGAWVMQQASAQLLLWDAHGGDDTFRVTVNLSTRQLESTELLDVLDGCLDAGVHPSRLVLEVTETALTIDSHAAMQTMQAIRARGVHLAVDDFGTGYSSLSRLRSAPVSRIKIDRSFISEIVDAAANVPIVEATMAIARGLGMGVIAEGVETVEQLHYLGRSLCPEVQGFLLSRPLHPDALFACMSEPPWAQLLPLSTAAAAPTDPFQRLVELAVDPRVALDRLIRPLLAELATATGLATTYLTRIELDGDVQEVSFLQNPTKSGLTEGLVGPWSQSLCKRALDRGPRRTSDTATDYPDSAVARELRLGSFIVEPITRPDGELCGTLCGTSERSVQLTEADSATVRMYARLIEQKIGGMEVTATRAALAVTTTLGQRRAAALEAWTTLRPALSRSMRHDSQQHEADRLLAGADRAWQTQADLIRSRAEQANADMRVVLVDDSQLPRQVLGLLIAAEDGMSLVGEADSAWCAVGVVAAEQPDILILDYELGDADAIEIIDHIRSLSPGTRVLLHSSRSDIHLLGQLMQVDRVVDKGADPEYLPAALRSLAH